MKLFEVIKAGHDFGGAPVLADVSFEIEAGESFGIIGPNGSGKSTLIKAMTALLSLHEGEVRYRGQSLKSLPKKELARQIAVLEQEGIPALSFSVEEIVAMGRYPWLKPFSDLSPRDKEIVQEVLDSLGLWEIRTQLVSTLSGGQRQLVSLARAMAQQPRVLILDEPTTYLDIGHQTLVMEHVRKWHAEQGITVIVVLHDLNLAAQYCTKLLLLEEGHVHSCGLVNDVLKENIISKVYDTELIMIEHPVLRVPQFLLTSK
ncbi:ABC transporter ATP-binding protein [Paradesulfitobacterium aromaticivorans]